MLSTFQQRAHAEHCSIPCPPRPGHPEPQRGYSWHRVLLHSHLHTISILTHLVIHTPSYIVHSVTHRDTRAQIFTHLCPQALTQYSHSHTYSHSLIRLYTQPCTQTHKHKYSHTCAYKHSHESLLEQDTFFWEEKRKVDSHLHSSLLSTSTSASESFSSSGAVTGTKGSGTPGFSIGSFLFRGCMEVGMGSGARDTMVVQGGLLTIFCCVGGANATLGATAFSKLLYE